MRLYTNFIVLLLLSSGIACSQGSSKSASDSSKAPDKGNSKDEKSSKQESSDAEEESKDAFYTGFDGNNTNFSILVPRFREISIKDPSIAMIEEVPVKLSEETITQMVTAAKSANPNFNEVRFRKMLGREKVTYRITPLKAGRTTLITAGGRGGQAGRKQSGWSKSKSIDLIVNSYTPDQIEAGRLRYITDGGGGNLRACASCHETGKEGAPPHELGRIMEISDKQAKTWITTGKVDGREAKVQHTWEFSSSEEEDGIVAFLRSKQTHDVETLTKLVVEEMLANGFGPGGPGGPGEGPMPPPGDIAPDVSSATVTSTTTATVVSTSTATSTTLSTATGR